MLGNEPLTAKYEGGAAGMYVTRKLRINGQDVDPYSPGFSGRFTADAELTAIFGGPVSVTVDDVPVATMNNMIRGAITNFNDGNKKLGFKVTLKPLPI